MAAKDSPPLDAQNTNSLFDLKLSISRYSQSQVNLIAACMVSTLKKPH